MAKVTVYSTSYCPYCDRAKRLLEDKKIEYKEINLDDDREGLQNIIKKTGMRTVPQIFIKDEFIGGFTELSALDQQGQLDKKLED